MGVEPAHIHRQLREMVECELLSATGPPGHGTEYFVHKDRVLQLERELAIAQPPWEIVQGQFGMRIDSIPVLADVAELLASEAWTSTVQWAIETGASGDGYLLVLSRATTAATLGRMRASLEAIGCTASPIRFGERFSAKGLRALAASFLDAADSGTAMR
jgi:hypothetical protein